MKRMGVSFAVAAALLIASSPTAAAANKEQQQLMAELRSAELDDWLTNTAGALAGWLPAMLWLRLRQDGQFATQRGSSTTLPPQAAKQSR